VKDENSEHYEMVKIVQLIHKIKLKMIKDRKKTSKQIPDTNMNKKKTIFMCIVEEEASAEPKYVWIDGKLRNITPGENADATNQKKKYKCKVITKGTKKMSRMSKDMKKISKKLLKVLKDIIRDDFPYRTYFISTCITQCEQ
jgi:hypothetical protein